MKLVMAEISRWQGSSLLVFPGEDHLPVGIKMSTLGRAYLSSTLNILIEGLDLLVMLPTMYKRTWLRELADVGGIMEFQLFPVAEKLSYSKGSTVMLSVFAHLCSRQAFANRITDYPHVVSKVSPRPPCPRAAISNFFGDSNLGLRVAI